MRSSANQQPSIVSTNAFAALDTKTKKKSKKSGKDKDEKSKKDKSKPSSSSHPASSIGFSTFPAVTEANAQDLDWAEDEDDDGFGIVPMASWVQEHQQKAAAQEEPEEPEEPEGNHQEMVDIAEQLGLEVAHDEDSEEESEPPSKPASRNVSEIAPFATRGIESKPEEKQLSKKERAHCPVVDKEKKLKEMQELAAVLGELGLDNEVQADSEGQDLKRKKKKKEKPKPATDANEKPALASEADPAAPSEPAAASVDIPDKPQEPPKLLDPAEAKKRLANKTTGKKKKTVVNPAFSRAAAEEAKVRAQKDAAQKDKDKKKHYNQQERR